MDFPPIGLRREAVAREREQGERPMPNAPIKPVYYELVIVATSPVTAIWLGDDEGHFV